MNVRAGGAGFSDKARALPFGGRLMSNTFVAEAILVSLA